MHAPCLPPYPAQQIKQTKAAMEYDKKIIKGCIELMGCRHMVDLEPGDLLLSRSVFSPVPFS